MALYKSAFPVGIAGGIFDAVLKYFLSSVVPEYVPSTFLVLAIYATLYVSSHAHEACWAYELSRKRMVAVKWVVLSLVVAWAVTFLLERGPGFFRAVSTIALTLAFS